VLTDGQQGLTRFVQGRRFGDGFGREAGVASGQTKADVTIHLWTVALSTWYLPASSLIGVPSR
jgi:hypothetical protein